MERGDIPNIASAPAETLLMLPLSISCAEYICVQIRLAAGQFEARRIELGSNQAGVLPSVFSYAWKLRGIVTTNAIMHFLLWCVVLNYLVLFTWSGLFVFAHDWMFRMHSRWFKLPVETLRQWGLADRHHRASGLGQQIRSYAALDMSQPERRFACAQHDEIRMNLQRQTDRRHVRSSTVEEKRRANALA
jgi:hypothetical protein